MLSLFNYVSFILIISQHSPSLDRSSIGQLLLTSLYSLPKSSNSSSSTSCCYNLRFISSSIAAARRILALPPGFLPPKPPSVESRSIRDLLSSILTSFVSYGGSSSSLSGVISNGYNFWGGLLMVSFPFFSLTICTTAPLITWSFPVMIVNTLPFFQCLLLILPWKYLQH